MSNKVTSAEVTTEIARRALLYRGLMRQIATRLRMSRGFVSKVLHGKHESGQRTQRVLEQAAKMVREFEKRNGIGPGRPANGDGL